MDREQQTRLRRATIVDAAMACFIQKGFHATSMRDVAQAAGVSLGNLYNHFAGKDALIAEVATLEQTELRPLLERLSAAAQPSRALIRDVLASYWDLCSQPAWGMLSAECLLEIARRPALAPHFDAQRRGLLDALAGAIVRGAACGHFVAAAPAPLLAQVLLDAVESDALRAALAPGAAPHAHAAVLHPGLLQALLAPCAPQP